MAFSAFFVVPHKLWQSWAKQRFSFQPFSTCSIVIQNLLKGTSKIPPAPALSRGYSELFRVIPTGKNKTQTRTPTLPCRSLCLLRAHSTRKLPKIHPHSSANSRKLPKNQARHFFGNFRIFSGICGNFRPLAPHNISLTPNYPQSPCLPHPLTHPLHLVLPIFRMSNCPSTIGYRQFRQGWSNQKILFAARLSYAVASNAFILHTSNFIIVWNLQPATSNLQPMSFTIHNLFV